MNKTEILDDIDELYVQLYDENIDLYHIPKVTQDSSVEDLEKTYIILRMKHDQNQRKKLKKEQTNIILACAYGCQYIFDGTRDIGEGFKPDLGPTAEYPNGWSGLIKEKIISGDFDELLDGLGMEYPKPELPYEIQLIMKLVDSAVKFYLQ